jgi:hypothetical protein
MDKEIDAKYLLTTKWKYFLKKASLAAE